MYYLHRENGRFGIRSDAPSVLSWHPDEDAARLALANLTGTTWKFSAEKCRQHRLAAANQHVEAVGFRFLPVTEKSETLARSQGSLPATAEAALERINANLPQGAPALTSDDVFLHVLEAGNNNLVADRWCFLHQSTLKNVAREAGEFRSLMNSHATGSMCAPAQLPYGVTYAGRYEEDSGAERAFVAAYMLARFYNAATGEYDLVRPNGAQGPSTAELNAMILAGVQRDVSLGLHPGEDGETLCDVCGKDPWEWDDDGCMHIPGTDRGLTPEQIKAQKARGVTTGYATYSLVNFHMGEVSSVYDGAVPGAGYRKALVASREGTLSGEHLAQARRSYSFGQRFLREHAPEVKVPEELTVPSPAADWTSVSEARTAAGFAEQDEQLAVEAFQQVSPRALAAEGMSEQVTRALAAVEPCISHAEQIRDLRKKDGRARLLGAETRERLSTLHGRLGELLDATLPPDTLSREQRIQQFHSRLDALCAHGAGETK